MRSHTRRDPVGRAGSTEWETVTTPEQNSGGAEITGKLEAGSPHYRRYYNRVLWSCDVINAFEACCQRRLTTVEVGVTASVDDLNIAKTNHSETIWRDKILLLAPFIVLLNMHSFLICIDR